MNRILHVLGMGGVGGVEKQTERFIHATHPDIRHDLVVCNKWIHPMFEETLSPLCEVFHWKYAWKIKLPGFLRSYHLRSWLNKRSYNAIFCYSLLSKPDLIESLVHRRDQSSNHRLIFYDQGASWDNGPEKEPLLKQFDHFVGVSTGSRVLLTEKFGVENDRITVIPNTLPEDEFERISSVPEPDTSDLPTSDQIPDQADDAFRLLFLGRLTHQKGIHVLIRALDHLPEDVQLVIVGSGNKEKQLQTLVNERNLTNRVTFAGLQEDPVPYLRWADLMVVPSIREPFGIVIEEAGAAGLPVIAPNIDGIPDMIRDGESGLLLEPTVPLSRWPAELKGYDPPDYVVDRSTDELMKPKYLEPERIAEAITSLKNDPDRARELGTNLQERIRSDFLFPSVLERYHDLLESDCQS